ncbi:MAG: DUF2272 domain-containing protein [Acetobacteraceae bacterium]|nr:DUF2272 domain-containing protein [Acetobacteraceae bacterium]
MTLRWLLLLACLAPAACAPPTARTDKHVPLFARVPYEPFSSQAVVAIALREWRLFGQPVDDELPSNRPTPMPEDKPERQPGLWQRVGEYWWIGLNPDTLETNWTGMHDSDGNVFPASNDGNFAWSAAFISYVMRIAGAGPNFPYAADHAEYINAAARKAGRFINAAAHTAGNADTNWVVTAERPSQYAPRPGDLICMGRVGARSLLFDDLPVAGHFPAHCDIVVDTAVPRQIAVIGGNVDDAVTLKHVPVTTDGKLATPDGAVLDTRYPWMVVLRVAPLQPPLS